MIQIRRLFKLFLVIASSVFLIAGIFSNRFIVLRELVGNEHRQTETFSCKVGVPCVYPEKVDFRIIVITYKRASSLEKLLTSLNTVEMDGDSARLEIWIDRSVNNSVNSSTLDVASKFSWTRGPTRVHVQQSHAGLYGQWIDTWSPHDKTKNSTEIAVILEDDLLVSPFIYRWLKAVHRHYGHRPEFFGATLVSDEPRGKESRHPPMYKHKNNTVYYHKYPDTWGLSPSPFHWNLFQQWFHMTYPGRTDFQPFVPDTVFTKWYKMFLKKGTAQHMWSMWIIYYTHMQQLFTIYNNLLLYSNRTDSCLTINRREEGLHYSKRHTGKQTVCKLMKEWSEDYVIFPQRTLMTHFNGNIIERYNIV